MTNWQWKKSLLNFLFFSGILLLVWAMDIYTDTVIDWRIPAGIWILTGIAATFINHKMLHRYAAGSLFLKFIYNCLAFGKIFLTLLMALNYYFPRQHDHIYLLYMLEKANFRESRRGCEKAYADVEIDGTIKRLAFDCGFSLDEYNVVQLTTRKGLLGFRIITDKVPMSDE